MKDYKFLIWLLAVAFSATVAVAADTYKAVESIEATKATEAKNVDVTVCSQKEIAAKYTDVNGNLVTVYAQDCKIYNLDMIDNGLADLETKKASLEAQLAAVTTEISDLKSLRAEVLTTAEAHIASEDAK